MLRHDPTGPRIRARLDIDRLQGRVVDVLQAAEVPALHLAGDPAVIKVFKSYALEGVPARQAFEQHL